MALAPWRDRSAPAAQLKARSVGQHGRTAPIHELLQAWGDFEASAAPLLLEGDEILAEPAISRRSTVLHAGWEEFIASPDFGAPDRRLHLGLIPKPFVGPIDTASIVVLMLNPGLNPVDYFAEYKVPAFRAASLSNLKGFPARESHPNMFLDPEFSWHSGFAYWHGKLRDLIHHHAAARGGALSHSLQVFSREIAFLELYPYHSQSFGLHPSVASKLRSAHLALSYAHDVLLPRAREGRTLLIVTRQGKAWGLSEERGVVVYSRGEVRGAHLTSRSRGGRAILQHIPAS